MKRREFLKAAGIAGGGVALLGLYCGRNVYARHKLEKQLTGESDAVLTPKALAELRDIPAQGKRAIQTWFHTPCLAGAEFALAVTSDEFRQRIANCATQDEQQLEFLLAFERHVTSAESILNQVQVIAEELGSELDLNWQACCQTLSKEWNIHVQNYGSALPDDFARSLEPMIQAHLAQALESAKSNGQRPALQETTGKIGESAIMLFPLARVPATTPIFLPLFVFVSVGHLFSYFTGLWKRNQSVEFIREAVSKRLALLGNRIGTEFESELKLCVTRLHEWQDHAVKTAARTHAENTVSMF